MTNLRSSRATNLALLTLLFLWPFSTQGQTLVRPGEFPIFLEDTTRDSSRPSFTFMFDGINVIVDTGVSFTSVFADSDFGRIRINEAIVTTATAISLTRDGGNQGILGQFSGVSPVASRQTFVTNGPLQGDTGSYNTHFDVSFLFPGADAVQTIVHGFCAIDSAAGSLAFYNYAGGQPAGCPSLPLPPVSPPAASVAEQPVAAEQPAVAEQPVVAEQPTQPLPQVVPQPIVIVADTNAIRSALFSGTPTAFTLRANILRGVQGHLRDVRQQVNQIRHGLSLIDQGQAAQTLSRLRRDRESNTSFYRFLNAIHEPALTYAALVENSRIVLAPGGAYMTVGSAGILPIQALHPATFQTSMQGFSWLPMALSSGIDWNHRMPEALLAGDVHFTKNPKEPVEETIPAETAPSLRRFEVWTGGDFSFYEQDALSTIEGFDTDSYSASIGAEYRLFPSLALGLAWSYSESNTNFPLGSVDTTGHAISAYLTGKWRNFYGNFLFSHSFLESDIQRNALNGMNARANPDSYANVVDANIGYNWKPGKWIIGPFAGLQWTQGETDAYSESGGGSANLDVGGIDIQSLESRVGLSAAYQHETSWGAIVPHVSVAWVHEHFNEEESVDIELQQSPFTRVQGNTILGRTESFGFNARGPEPGTDYVNIQAGLGIRYKDRVKLDFTYFVNPLRDAAIEHGGALRLGVLF